ncbi:MAG TPA: DUF2491 family protein [Desulfomonilaceae bacterium]|nr:DUF2491 family protein [Desulfomonilaceae bacterium]
MADTFGLLKRIGMKKFDQLKDTFQSTGERVDKDLPLGLRIRGMVDIPQVDFILAGDALKITYPGPSCIVASYGFIVMGKNMIHRFYLQASENVYLLQIVTDDRKAVQECKLFMTYDEVYPDDWDFWLSERDGYIGYQMFDTKDGTRYLRVWEDQDAEVVVEQDGKGNTITRIPPVEFLETVYHDQFGKESETVKNDSMLYGRHVNDTLDEYLLVSAVNEQDGACVRIMAGIELESTSLKVI